jgi:hypothetical protein
MEKSFMSFMSEAQRELLLLLTNCESLSLSDCHVVAVAYIRLKFPDMTVRDMGIVLKNVMFLIKECRGENDRGNHIEHAEPVTGGGAGKAQ